MSRIARLAIMLGVIALAGCTSGILSTSSLSTASNQGQAIASENNFDNGVKQYEMGHYRQAIHQFEKAIEKDPSNYQAYYYLGMSHGAEGSYNTGLGFLDKALDLVPVGNTWMNRIQTAIQNMTQEQEGNNQGHGRGHDK